MLYTGHTGKNNKCKLCAHNTTEYTHRGSFIITSLRGMESWLTAKIDCNTSGILLHFCTGVRRQFLRSTLPQTRPIDQRQILLKATYSAYHLSIIFRFSNFGRVCFLILISFIWHMTMWQGKFENAISTVIKILQPNCFQGSYSNTPPSPTPS